MHCPLLGDKVDHGNPMPESTISPSQGLKIGHLQDVIYLPLPSLSLLFFFPWVLSIRVLQYFSGFSGFLLFILFLYFWYIFSCGPRDRHIFSTGCLVLSCCFYSVLIFCQAYFYLYPPCPKSKIIFSL
jgi:hypothetical protein